MVAFSVARLTFAFWTLGVFLSAVSTLRTQLAQCMPLTGSSVFCIRFRVFFKGVLAVCSAEIICFSFVRTLVRYVFLHFHFADRVDFFAPKHGLLPPKCAD